MESVLTSLKKLLNITEDNIHYDTDVCILANGAFMILNQLGVGPVVGFSISDKSKLWSDFILPGPIQEGVKNYIYMKIKLTFDPPTTASVLDSMARMITELEHRLLLMAEFGTPLSEAGGFFTDPVEVV
jgi:hypothetical protein